MRLVIYSVAALIAAGLVYVIGTSGDHAGDAPESGQVASVASFAEGDLVSLHVPDMHCIYACYPKVKETLEHQPGVMAVDLSEQQEEGTIDNPIVLVTVSPDFDMTNTVNSLSNAGFAKSQVVQ